MNWSGLLLGLLTAEAKCREFDPDAPPPTHDEVRQIVALGVEVDKELAAKNPNEDPQR